MSLYFDFPLEGKNFVLWDFVIGTELRRKEIFFNNLIKEFPSSRENIKFERY